MFPVQVEFHRDELLVSYAARTARANGLLGVEDLFKDLEISAQAFHAGDSGAIERFASAAEINPERARAQTFHAVADDRFTIADELLCQSARKTDPLSASKIDPPCAVEIRA